MAKRAVVEVCCDRCTKVFYEQEDETSYLCSFSLSLGAEALSYRELCATCRAVVQRAAESCAPPPRALKKDS